MHLNHMHLNHMHLNHHPNRMSPTPSSLDPYRYDREHPSNEVPGVNDERFQCNPCVPSSSG